jgi:uncharacterized protein (DUF2267 family)
MAEPLPAAQVRVSWAELATPSSGLGQHPNGRPLHSRNDFLERIHDGLHRDPGIDPEQVARAVLALVSDRLPAAEVEDAKAGTPHSLRALWPS